MAWTTPTTFVSGAILTAAQMNTNVRDNTNALYDSIKRLAWQTRGSAGTDNFTVSDTTSPGSADIFSSDATWTADGTSTYWVETYFSIVEVGATAGSEVIVTLVDGAGTLIYRLGVIGQASVRHPLHIRVPYTPASGSRSVNVRAYRSVSNGTMYAGSPGPIAYLAVYGPDIT